MEKTKKRKIIITIVAIVLIAALIAAGIFIGIKIKEHKYDDATVDVSPTVYDENYIDPSLADDLFEMDFTEPEPIAYNEKLDKTVDVNMSDFISDLSEEDVDMEFSALFKTKDYLKNQKPVKSVSQHKYDITDGTGEIDAGVLYDVVQENNRKYFEQFKNQDDADVDSEMQSFEKLPKKTIEKTCKYIADYVNKASKSEDWQDVDFERVYCNLSTLRIMHRMYADFSLAYVDENNVLSINPEVLENNKSMLAPDTDMTDKEMEQYAWDVTLVHEIVHLLQDSCPCIEEDDELLLANMRCKDDDELHTLFDFWLVEASAELGMTDMTGKGPNTYFNYINYYYSMTSAFYLDPGVSPKKVMRITFDKDNYPFYKAFGKLSEKETEEIINALYSIEVMSYDTEGFVEAYKGKYGIDLSAVENEDKQELVHQKLRLNALKAFTKRFYISLAKQIEEKKMSYNDMFYLIKVFERQLFDHLCYNEEDRAMMSNKFFDYYLDIQEEFFDELEGKVFSEKELTEEFEKYTTKCKKGKQTVDNFDFSWMSREQKYALEKIEENYFCFDIKTIRSYKALYVEKGYDKSVKY